MAKENKYKCYFCLKRQMRYTPMHRVCDACGTIQEKVGRGNHRKVPMSKFTRSRKRGAMKSPAIGNRRTVLAPAIEMLLKAK